MKPFQLSSHSTFPVFCPFVLTSLTMASSSSSSSEVSELSALVTRLHEQTQKSLSQLSHSLHSKVDRLVRQVDDVLEQQKKINKAMQNISKEKGKSSKVSEPTIRQQTEEQPPAPQAAIAAVVPQVTVPHHWSKNLLLIGDGEWNCFQQVPEIVMVLEAWQKQFGMKIMSKPEETLSRMYDAKRAKLLFALPPGVEKVAVSVGAEDLCDARLLTLDIASLEEVRKQNRPVLVEKCRVLQAMVDYLLKQNKGVVLLLPPQRERRSEILQHWEEVVLEQLAPLKSNKFKIINLPNEMRSSMSSFDSPEEYISTWFSETSNRNPDKRSLSQFGARKLMDLLEKSLTTYLPENPSHGCPRCTRLHPGGEDSCKSREKMCRRCNRIGHFTDIHEVKDKAFQDVILRTLGGHIEFNGNFRFLVEPSPEEAAAMGLAPPAKRAKSNGTNSNKQPLGKKKSYGPPSFHDWYGSAQGETK